MLQVLVDKSAYADSIGDIYVEAANITEDSLGDIYLPAQINDNVQLFIKSVIHYNESKRPLRYLFAGKPGTAKTKIIRAIAKACTAKATFIFSTGNERRIESLFEFAEMFSPVVLCIDDIDLMTGSRSEGLYTPRLASFLQKLDGFVRQDFFLLATTNDKRLVDLAASRPGRFDLVIDVNLIEPRQYLELVKSKTQNIDIINPETCVKNGYNFNLEILCKANVTASLSRKCSGNLSIGRLPECTSSPGISKRRALSELRVIV